MSDRVSRTRRGLLVAISSATTALAGCIATGRGEVETRTETIDPDDVETVSASTTNGALLVTDATGETGRVRLEKAAGIESDLDAIDAEVELDGGVMRVDVDIDNDETAFLLGPGPKADLEVALPSGVSLSQSGTVNGDVNVSEVDRDIDVSTVNGDIAVATTGDTVNAETTNGDVYVEVDAADVTASSTNGDVEILASATLEATVSLSATNGDVSLDGFERTADVTTGSSLIETVGDGTYEVDASTTNGDVELRGRGANENT